MAVPVSPAEPWPWAVTSVLALLVALAGVGVAGPRRVAVTVGIVTQVPGLVLVAVWPDRGGPAALISLVVLSAAVMVAADAWRGRRDARARLSEQEQLSESERARRALLEERSRIARELHDVVAHHMSVISVQAASAPVRVRDLDEARSEFLSIAGSARTSLTEMRSLLGVLRDDDPGGRAPRAPVPGLADLPALVEGAVRAGVSATLAVEGVDEVSIPAGIGLAVHRTVQEALSNVVRHASGADAAVTVACRGPDGDRGLAVEVTNGPPDRPAEAPLGAGHGLLGMRERLGLHGGTLQVGPGPGGGFRVVAWLPLPAAGQGQR